MTRLLSKLLVTTALLSGPASADTTITIGYWDPTVGPGVNTIASSPGTKIDVGGLGEPTFGSFTGEAISIIENGYDVFAVDWVQTPRNGQVRIYASF